MISKGIRPKLGIILAFLFIQLLWTVKGQEIKIYVSPDGNDRYSGSESQPLKSFEGAQKAVRTILQQQPGEKITVNFKGGIYPMEKTLVFTAEDSGNSKTASVTYCASEGEIPVFLGSKPLSQWTLVYDTKLLKQLDASARGKIYVTDLKAAGITDWGDPTTLGKRPDLYCNQQLQTLARYPNEGFVHSGKAKGATLMHETYIKVHGTVEGIFEYTDKHQDKWENEPDVRLLGYWYWDWSDEYQKPARWDRAKRTVYIQEPYHSKGYKDGFRYFGLNLFCEIDQAGEWYLNRENGLLYWYPPQGIDPTKAEVCLTDFNAPFMVEINDCSYITLKGLTFREGRGSAIILRNGSNNLLSECRIERFGQDGIRIVNGNNHGVDGCYLSTLGCGGIKINGGDRKTLTPCNHFVENTLVDNFSFFKRTYEPAVQFEGCGMRIAHNRFQFSSSSAIRLDGNDILVEYNQVNHVVNESDDQGGIDMWNNPSFQGNIFRYNYWSDIKGGVRHGAAGIRLDDIICGTLIFGNLFERCGMLDFGAVQIHGGKDNIVENNFFYKCHAAVSFTNWNPDRYLNALESEPIKRRLYEEVDIRSDLYKSRYPKLQTIRENINVNTIIDNLILNCDTVFLPNRYTPQIERNNIVFKNIENDPTFDLPTILKKNHIKPIPIHMVGPKDNPWLNGRDKTMALPFDPKTTGEFFNRMVDNR